MDPVFVAKPVKRMTYELMSVVIDDPSGNTEAVNDVVFNEVDHIRGFHFHQRYRFCPLGEVVRNGKDKPVPFGGRRADRPNDVHSPCFK
ncbi:hypothetical protein ACDT16_13660 [Staphylococcus aureus]